MAGSVAEDVEKVSWTHMGWAREEGSSGLLRKANGPERDIMTSVTCRPDVQSLWASNLSKEDTQGRVGGGRVEVLGASCPL